MSKLRVAVVGAGPAGLALGLALQRTGVSCRLFDARRRDAVRDDRRVLALSHGSRQILERLGAWDGVGATPIGAIHVSQKGGLGRTVIEADEEGVPALGYVATAGALGAALVAACDAAEVAVQHETRVEAALPRAGNIALHTRSPQAEAEHAAELVAWAEGAVEDAADWAGRDYGQQAIVAEVATREAHGNLAFERFTSSGPVALLPHGGRYALVCALPRAEASALLALDEAPFLDWLQRVFAGRLHFTSVGERLAFPLGLRYRQRPVGERAVWLGNAAQTLHPVAGQGFNLALRDVSELARLLAGAPGDCGDVALLAHYASARRLDRRGVIGFTDSLVRVFANDNPVLHHGRGAALLLLDLFPAARGFLARRMIFGARAWP